MLIAPPIDEGERVSKERIWYVMLVKVICIHRLAYYGRRQKLSLLFCLSLPATPHFATYITYICSRSYSKSFGERFFSCQCQQRYYLDTCCATVSANLAKMQCGLVLLVVTDSLFECKKKPKESSQERPRFLTDQLYFFLLNLPESMNLISKSQWPAQSERPASIV